jgi:hypothetical protein
MEVATGTDHRENHCSCDRYCPSWPEKSSWWECADRRSDFRVPVDIAGKYDPFPFGAIKEAASEKLRVQCFFQIPAG